MSVAKSSLRTYASTDKVMENKFPSRTYGFTHNFRIRTICLPRTSLQQTIKIMLLPTLMLLPTVYEKIFASTPLYREKRYMIFIKGCHPSCMRVRVCGCVLACVCTCVLACVLACAGACLAWVRATVRE